MRMRKSLVHRVLFVVIILVIVTLSEIVIGYVSKKAIRNVRDVGVNQTNTAQALFNRNADILILGSSRANHSFDCNILKKELNMSCYNAGRDGMNIMYDGMLLFSYLQRYTPKIVVLDVVESMLNKSWNESWRDMICFYGMSDALDVIIDSLSSPIERIQLRSNIYRYNKTWEWLLNARIAKSQAHLDGYRPLQILVNHPQGAKMETYNFVVDEHNLIMLSKIVDTCKHNNIKLIFTYTPSLIVEEGNFHKYLSAYCKKKDIPLMDWNGDMLFVKHPEWFYDMTHLNERGAGIFTRNFVMSCVTRDVL